MTDQTKPGKSKIGVAIDHYKERTYKRAIEQAGFDIDSIGKISDDIVVIRVWCDKTEQFKLGQLLKKLEQKYSTRNRFN